MRAGRRIPGVNLPPLAKLLVPGTMKNSLLTTNTGGRVMRSGRVQSIPGRNRKRAEARRFWGNRPSVSMRKLGRHRPSVVLRVRLRSRRFS
jgi:hypothetical protein